MGNSLLFTDSVKAPPRDDKLWFVIVEEYSCRNLTRPSNRLPALSGLAALYLKHNQSNEQYFAGLWESSFIYGLHWESNADIKEYIARYHAPSWSWPSVMGHVEYSTVLNLDSGVEESSVEESSVEESRLLRELEVLLDCGKSVGTQIVAQVLNIECELKGSNPFGEVVGGTMLLRGLLLDARLSLKPATNRRNIFSLELMDPTGISNCSGDGTPPHSCIMPDWVGETALPYLSDRKWVRFDSEVELVTIPQSPPRCCAYLRRHQQQRHVDGLSDSWTPDEIAKACVHVHVLFLTYATKSLMKNELRCITGLVLGRPDPSKEVYERLALFCSVRDTSDVKNEPKHFSGGVKDVVII